MSISALLTVFLLALPTLRAQSLETYVVPESAERVPDRSERIDIVWPQDQGWVETGRETQDRVQTISFVSSGEFSNADVTVFYGMWDANHDKARQLFVSKVRQECDSLFVRPWFETQDELARTIQVYECHSDQPYGLVQLLLQGLDNFYAVELYHPQGLIDEGQLLPWIEFFKEVDLCYQGSKQKPCRSELWPEP